MAAVPVSAQTPDYERLAEASFESDDYIATRRNLELALQNENDPARQVELQRKLAAAYIFDGELTAARKIYEDLIDAAAAARRQPDAHDHYALAVIGAIQHKKYDVQKHLLAGDSVHPRVHYAPMLHAITWAHVGEVDRVARAKADMEGIAASQPQDTMAQQAAALTRLIYATKLRAFDVARAEMEAITAESLRAYANVFLANATRREGKRGEAAAIDEDVHKFKELSIYSAAAWRLIK
jgi:hypothetical protein